MFRLGERVDKANGYAFPGEVVSIFKTKSGNTRYVVENTTFIGLVHIFNEEQLRSKSKPPNSEAVQLLLDFK